MTTKRVSKHPSVLKDLKFLLSLRTEKKHKRLELFEYPFDAQLLNLSSIYRYSRELYLKLGGHFSPRLCSTMRGLSTQDLFKNDIQYTPSFTEWQWFSEHGFRMSDADEELQALERFNEISVFHEQNHRIVWQMLPPPPTEKRDMQRYLNFAESIVVTLDLVLGDQLGKKTSSAFERMRLIYRPGGDDKYSQKSNTDYRSYLLAALITTYYMLETMHTDDIPKAVNYVLPGQKQINKIGVRRGLQLSELFARVTNPQWIELNWTSAQKKLNRIHRGSMEALLYLPEDPLDIEENELAIIDRIFDHFGI